MSALLFGITAYLALPVVTIYSCFSAIYLLDIRDPDFISYLVLWVPGIFLYYIYISQLVIGQRLPFLDRIWGFPNIIRKHQRLFSYVMGITLVLHTIVHLSEDGFEKVVLRPDSGMIVIYISIFASVALMYIAAKIWLKPQTKKQKKVADYAKMHRLHQLFYLLAVGVWYHVVTAGAFDDNLLGQSLVTGYLLFALLCKLYMLILHQKAPIYELQTMEILHENFVRLRLCAREGNLSHNSMQKALSTHQGGQYAYFAFAVSDEKGRKHWEEHPFSFAGYAPQDSSQDSQNSTLSVVAKKLGNFTARLPEIPLGSKVKVLGPYGKFGCERKKYPEGLHLVAAGIGITPFLSMLEQKAYCAQKEGNQSFTQPLTLHWFVHDQSELVFEDRFDYFREHLPNLNIQTYVGQRLTRSKLEQVLQTKPTGRKTGVLYCGPPAVAPALRSAMTRIGIPKVNFHTELFSM